MVHVQIGLHLLTIRLKCKRSLFRLQYNALTAPPPVTHGAKYCFYFWGHFWSIWLLRTVQILLFSQKDQNNFLPFSLLGKRLRTDINVSFCLRGRLEEIGAVATVERAMGVKRELNAHDDEREEGGLTYHKCQPRAGNIFIKCSCNKYPHIPYRSILVHTAQVFVQIYA